MNYSVYILELKWKNMNCKTYHGPGHLVLCKKSEMHLRSLLLAFALMVSPWCPAYFSDFFFNNPHSWTLSYPLFLSLELIEHILCARHCPRGWDHKRKVNVSHPEKGYHGSKPHKLLTITMRSLVYQFCCCYLFLCPPHINFWGLYWFLGSTLPKMWCNMFSN